MARRPAPAPGAKTPGAYHHGDLKRALVDIGAALVVEHGADRFTLREAARRAGVNHRAVYRHFPDKRALLAAIALEGYRALTDALRRALETGRCGDPAAGLLACARAYAGWALAHPGDYQVLFGPRLNEDGRFPALEEEARRLIALVSEEVRRVSPGKDEHALLAATLGLWAALHGAVELVLLRRIRVRPERAVDYVATLARPAVLAALS